MSLVEQAEREMQRAQQAGAQFVRDGDIDFDRWAMTPSERAKVRPSSDWEQALVDHFSAPQETRGAYLPWSKTHGDVRIRPGELSIWAGVNGHGKSLVLSQVVLSLITQGETACIASMEMRPIATLARMSRQAIGTDDPAPRAIRAFHEMLSGSLWLYDQQGTVRMDRMLAVLRYAREELQVQHFVIDSLMKCGIAGDDYNAQKRFVDQLSTYARDSGVHIHLVAHSRKRETEHSLMDKFDIKGASELSDMPDNVFSLWRNKAKEAKAEAGKLDEEGKAAPDAVLMCDKQRHGDWEGRVTLWFNRKTLQYVGRNTTQPIDYLKKGGVDDLFGEEGGHDS
jgi:twinkle protein